MAKINIDFQILTTHDPKVITIVDTSEWGLIETKPAIIEIIVPGETKPSVHFFQKHKVTVLNSKNLNVDCKNDGVYLNLPDGIYFITVKGSPDTYSKTRQFLKTDSTRLELDQYIVDLNLESGDFTKELLDKVQRINMFIEAAESNTRLGNYSGAQSLLFKAQRTLDKLKKCKTCV